MKRIRKLALTAVIATVAALPLSQANAWWGWGPWDGWGDGWGGFSFHMGGGFSGWGDSWYNPYWGGPWGSPYYGYWGAPYYGYPYAAPAVALAQPAETSSK